MPYTDNQKLLSGRLNTYSLILLSLLTGLILVSLLWDLFIQQREKTINIALNIAKTTFEKDILYRRWAAKQGGIYVPVSDHLPPNPYLTVADRDITASFGLSLTLVNPAYMARQVNQMAMEGHGSRSHLTSLNPIRPENAPDSWETSALNSFERGVQEISSVEQIEGEGYMRFMRPFVTEKACLKCHASQGYKEGDIRGGVSVSVPMAPLWAIERPHVIHTSLAHFFIWIVCLTGIMASKKILEKQILAREYSEKALQEANESLEQRVQERTMDLQTLTQQLEMSRHELRNLASELVMAEERERKRIAGVLHDDIAQILASVRMRLDLLQGTPSDEMDKTLKETKSLLTQSLQETRALMNDLGNPLLFDMGLKPACEALANRLMDKHAVRISCDIRDEYKRLDPDVKAILYQLIRELLNNVVKHSRAQNAHVMIDMQNGHFRLKVTDDGVGFDPQTLGAPTVDGGFGLYSIRERLIAIDGSFRIESAPGSGTVVTAILPAALG
jgi:signal transduction histidine kinase